jgi:hypothetical protein
MMRTLDSLVSWRILRESDERKELEARFKDLSAPNVVSALKDLYMLLDWKEEDRIHKALNTDEPKEATKAYVVGMRDIKRLIEPIIKGERDA